MKKFLILIFVCLLVFSGCAKEPTYTVSFDTQGGSVVEPQIVVKGDKVKKPTDPTKECECVFDGWYVGDEKWSFIGYTVTEDITITAKWVKCYGLNKKELEALQMYISLYDSEYTWEDVTDVQRDDPYVTNTGRVCENQYGYRVTFNDGGKRTYALFKDNV